MKNKSARGDNSFLTIDLPDFITDKGYVLIGPTGQPIHVSQYRRRAGRSAFSPLPRPIPA